MQDIALSNRPLVEAIFELRWELPPTPTGLRSDPNYGIIIGKLYSALEKKYDYYEQLPAANVPNEMAEYVIQHRFRIDKDKWPLIQIGPGIITVNDTQNYDWPDFEDRVLEAFKCLRAVYQTRDVSLDVTNLSLRYIDSVNFDFERKDLFTFLEDKLHANASLRPELFKESNIVKCPLHFDWRISFAATKPNGICGLRIWTAKRDGVNAFFWETIVQSNEDQILKDPFELEVWLTEAHTITHNWFYKLTEGELFESFK
ncbi:MAG: TIGR04255 family protein [Halobacteriota archaeon]